LRRSRAARKPAKSACIGGETLFGLYEGVPRAERGSGYFGVLPDKITIFKQPLEEQSAGDERRLEQLLRDVVLHEIGHHLGFDNEELGAIERRRK